jgi:hypothetical protein
MRRHFACLALLLLSFAGLNAAEDVGVVLKGIVKSARAGNQEALAPLQDLHMHKQAGDAVLSLVGDKRAGIGLKLRLAEIVAGWPEGEGRKTLADWLAKHPNCDDDALMFFSGIHLMEARTFFWNILNQAKGPLTAVKEPERIALAARALGGFQDNPEVVVARVAELLAPANPHVMRACAAEALGGMRSPLSLQALLPHLNDDAIGDLVHCSLFQLTGQDFANDPDKWKAWITAQGANIPWKMLARADYAEFLKLQKLLKPLDDDSAGGGTPMCEAFNHALTRILPEGNIDAIYFLSDGQPSDGTPAMVLDLAQRIHTQFKVRISTISIGEEPTKNLDQLSLLNQIANTCGGTFTVPP